MIKELLSNRSNQSPSIRPRHERIKKQLASISDHPDFCTEAGKVRGNTKKNRYKDILPFDQTRVPLTLLLDEGYSDYINANFIRGIDGERYYIATQGPLSQTVVDFWRMIWEFRVKVIAMACREIELGKKKCERYWATEEETATFGPFTVTNVGEETLRNEVTIRTLSLTLLGETRSIYQFQYTAWPDHGIPQDFDCLLEMIGLVHQRQDKLRAPICVHCSAGCGRTGVICIVDYVRSLLHRKLIGEGFDVAEIVRQTRLQRPAAVQTKDQFEFVHRIVAAMFRGELAGVEPDYENWKEGRRAPLFQDVNQPIVSTSILRPKPLSLPKKATRPQPADSMPTDGGTGDTYAAVARPKAGTPRPATGPSPRADYENLGLCDKALNQQPLYGTVTVKENPGLPSAPTQYANLDPPPKTKEPPAPSYAAINFGAAGQDSPAVDSDVDDENWAPTLPRRTSDSYIVHDPDHSRGTLPPSNDGKGPSKLRNIFQLGVAGAQGKKGVDPTSDDGYEDVGSLFGPDSTFSSSNLLGYNNRVPKPKGPRDPPEEWSCYER